VSVAVPDFLLKVAGYKGSGLLLPWLPTCLLVISHFKSKYANSVKSVGGVFNAHLLFLGCEALAE